MRLNFTSSIDLSTKYRLEMVLGFVTQKYTGIFFVPQDKN